MQTKADHLDTHVGSTPNCGTVEARRLTPDLFASSDEGCLFLQCQETFDMNCAGINFHSSTSFSFSHREANNINKIDW